MTDKEFDAWFEELEGYSFRSERFYDDFDYASKTKDYKIIIQWLKTAFETGYEVGQQIYGGTE
jgi:hypothetical protein